MANRREKECVQRISLANGDQSVADLDTSKSDDDDDDEVEKVEHQDVPDTEMFPKVLKFTEIPPCYVWQQAQILRQTSAPRAVTPPRRLSPVKEKGETPYRFRS